MYVWDGKVIMSKPISCACDIAFKVMLLPCPSKISNCLLVKEFFWRKSGTPWRRKKSSMPFFALPCKSLVYKI